MTEQTDLPQAQSGLLREQLPVILTELAVCALMLGVYALLRRLTLAVCLGTALGAVVALLNYGAMILGLLRAERAESPEKGQLLVRGLFLLRTLVLLALLIVALKSGWFDPVATLLPLVWMRIAILAAELLFRRKKKKEGA